MRHPCEKGFMS